MEVKLIIAGSRDFNNYELLKEKVDDYLLSTLAPDRKLYDEFIIQLLYNEKSTYSFHIEIVSGGARGADRLGERYAKERKLAVKQFIPN